MGHSPWGLKESGTSEGTEHACRQLKQRGLSQKGGPAAASSALHPWPPPFASALKERQKGTGS